MERDIMLYMQVIVRIIIINYEQYEQSLAYI